MQNITAPGLSYGQHTVSTQRFLGAWRVEGAALQAAVNFLDAVFGLFDATFETLLLAG